MSVARILISAADGGNSTAWLTNPESFTGNSDQLSSSRAHKFIIRRMAGYENKRVMHNRGRRKQLQVF